MAAYIDDEAIIQLILKFLSELLDNSTNRLKFDSWNVNGLIMYKECSTLMIQYLELFNCLSPAKKLVNSENAYVELYKPLKTVMLMLQRCVTGNFINFAICDFY